MVVWKKTSCSKCKTKRRRFKNKISVSINEIITGVHKVIKLQRLVNCQECSGTGAKNKKSIVDCDGCGGSGTATIRQQTQMGMMIQQYTCPKCNGSGKK